MAKTAQQCCKTAVIRAKHYTVHVPYLRENTTYAELELLTHVKEQFETPKAS